MHENKLSFMKYLSGQPQDLRELFIKVINLHAGYQLEKPSKKELFGRIRNEIEQTIKKGR